MSEFHDEILGLDEMALIHDALIGRFCWFEHVGRFSRYGSYQIGGIEPRDPSRDDDGCETHKKQPPSKVPDLVVCLRPVGTFDSTPNRGDRQFRMAISNRDLPPAIGLDRSHGPAMKLAAILRADNPGWANSDIFIEVARRLGSFVSYCLIPPAVIRVQTMDASDGHQECWPRLIGTDVSQVRIF